MRKILFAVLTIFNFFLEGQNFTANYNFINVTTSSGKTDPGPAPQVQGLQFGNFYASNSAANPNASERFSFGNWPVGAPNGSDNYGDYTAVLSPTTYYEVGIRVSPGYTLTLNSISFYVRRSGTGIRTYCVRSSRDNYMNNLSASTGTSINLAVIPDDIFFWKYDNLSTASDQRGSTVMLYTTFKNITDTVAFRFYAWNSEAGGGTFSIDNVSFSGMVIDSAFNSNPVGIKRAKETETLRIFPNPVVDEVLTIVSEETIEEFEITDLAGITKVKERPRLKRVEIRMEDLDPGLYFLKIWSGEKLLVRKILVL